MAELAKETIADPVAPEAGFSQAPEARSVFVSDPQGLPAAMDSPFWTALPTWGELSALDDCADIEPATEFRVSHDANSLAVQIRCEEPDMAGLWQRRSSENGRLDLDDSIEILLDPYHAHGFRWSICVTPSGQWEAVIPIGACAKPECAVEVRTLPDAWEVLVSIPFVDIGLEGDLRGTPINGDTWGMAVVRRRREAVSGSAAGRREAAAWSAKPMLSMPAEAFGHLCFEGGRDKRPAEFTKYNAGGFGVNEICVGFEGGKIPADLEVSLKPSPAARLRSKDASRYKFRVARPSLYRYMLRLPYTPPPEATEEELADLESEAGRELTEDELAEQLAGRVGVPEYVAGLSFLLPDLWAEIEDMETQVENLRRKLNETGTAFSDAKNKLFDGFEEALNEVDRYRAPHAKGKLAPELVDKLKEKYARARAAGRGALLRHGKLSVATSYLPSGKWHLGALRVRTNHSDGTEAAEAILPKLRAAGLDFAAFADRPEGGDQDGDGTNDWNGDGTTQSAARKIEGTNRAVRKDRGREAYVRDYSKAAAEQGKSWVSENWKLSTEGEFVVLRAVEVGPHHPALCLGVPAGALPAGSADSYEQIRRTQDAGGVAVMCEALGDIRELPLDLSQALGIDTPAEAWERLLAKGRKLFLFPGTKIDGADLTAGALPEKAAIVGVLASAHTEAAILEALRRGSFYYTTGPRLIGVEAKGDTVTVKTEEDCQIFFRGETGQVLSGAYGSEASYRFTGKERYVRAVCLSDVLEDGFRLEATTQPIYLSDDLPRSPLGATDADWTIAEPVDRSDEPEDEPEEEPEAEPEIEPEAEPEEEPADEAEEEPEEEEPEEEEPEEEEPEEEEPEEEAEETAAEE